MSTHNICFHAEIRKICFFDRKQCPIWGYDIKIVYSCVIIKDLSCASHQASSRHTVFDLITTHTPISAQSSDCIQYTFCLLLYKVPI